MTRLFACLTFMAYAGYVSPENYLFTSDAQRLLNLRILAVITIAMIIYRVIQFFVKKSYK
jgi:hypothetical protein